MNSLNECNNLQVSGEVAYPCEELEQKLSDSQRASLEKHEKCLQDFLLSFIDVGEALQAIREEQLYRENYPSFEVYCRTRWNFSRQRAYQLIDAARVAEYLSTRVDTEPTSEAQVRPLVSLSAEQAVEVWNYAEKLAGARGISGPFVKKAITALGGSYAAPPAKKSASSGGVVTSLIEADDSVSSTEDECENVETSLDHEVEVSTPKLEQSLTAKEHGGLPGASFELADGTLSDEYRFTGEDDLLPVEYIESKLAAKKENNLKAPQHLQVEPETLALRQSAFLKLASVANQIAGVSPTSAEKDQLYWAIEDLRHITAFLRPVTHYASEGDEESDAGDE